jgi:hypothetical protein
VKFRRTGQPHDINRLTYHKEKGINLEARRPHVCNRPQYKAILHVCMHTDWAKDAGGLCSAFRIQCLDACSKDVNSGVIQYASNRLSTNHIRPVNMQLMKWQCLQSCNSPQKRSNYLMQKN